MNTATAYANRAREALAEARVAYAVIEQSDRELTRAELTRPARLADYAQQCANLAYESAGSRETRPVTAAFHATDRAAAYAARAADLVANR